MKLFPSLLLTALAVSLPAWADVPTSLKVIQKVDREGAGNEQATQAWKELAAAKGDDLTALLSGMDGANPLAQNWIRAAVAAIEDREGKKLPVAKLEAFVQSTKHSPGARALAFDILARIAPEKAESLTPQLLEDPASELRRHPVAKLIESGDALQARGSKDEAAAAYQQALKSARDEDQIKPLAKKLRDLGKTVDLPTHFGFVMNWKVIAPFSNAERKGFDEVFPPEKELSFSATYPGKGKDAKWVDFTSTDEYGKIDLNKPFGMEKEVVGYAASEFISKEARPAEIRIGCKNGWKVWLNGKLLFARDEYHRGAKLDQYKLPCQLQAGKNTILVKCCQNEQKETWTVEWEFQLRVCDATGTAIVAAR